MCVIVYLIMCVIVLVLWYITVGNLILCLDVSEHV